MTQKYFHTDETKIDNFSPDFIDEMYEKGYVFTRIDKGVMDQTRSIRIDLAKFELSSENRRILKKTDGLECRNEPLPFVNYDFKIGKLAKDFYAEKFGDSVMSAQKIKEMLTNAEKSNFNTILTYSTPENITIGYTICHSTKNTLHYSYPFYDLANAPKDMGLGMMIRAIIHAKENNMKYIYLGSLQRSTDTYKLQFSGLQWFDSKMWSNDIEMVKSMLTK